DELPGLGVVGRDVAANAILTATHADQYTSLHDARRLRDGECLALITGHHAPQRLAAPRIERHQSAIERAEVDLALPGGHSAVDHVAACLDTILARDFGVVGPEQLAGRRVICFHHAPRGRDVHYAVDDQRRSLLPAISIEIGIPGQAELLRVVRVD